RCPDRAKTANNTRQRPSPENDYVGRTVSGTSSATTVRRLGRRTASHKNAKLVIVFSSAVLYLVILALYSPPMPFLRLLLLSFLICADLPAQTIRASIYGRVLDPSGGAVSGARVKAIHADTNTTAFFVSDDLGNYDFPRLLQFGEYRLEVEAPGFQKLIRSG